MLMDLQGRLVACHLYDAEVYKAPIKVGASA